MLLSPFPKAKKVQVSPDSKLAGPSTPSVICNSRSCLVAKMLDGVGVPLAGAYLVVTAKYMIYESFKNLVSNWMNKAPES